MDLRTYRSRTMAGALAEVKKDLGPDAVILRTRSYKAGGVLGFGGNSIVEITAAREEHAPKVYEPVRRTPPASPPREARPERPAVTPGRPVRVAAPAPASPSPSGPEALSAQVADLADRGAKRELAATRVEMRPVSSDAYATLESELASIRRMVGQVLQTTRRTAVRVDGADAFSLLGTDRADPLFDLYTTLGEHDTPQAVLDDLAADTRSELSGDELRDPAIVRETLLRILGARFRVVAPCEMTPGSPVVEALVGPTGVGKTTTIAKLAAAHKLRYGRSVGLITADTYRIAAVEQLRTYAGIIGLSLEVVLTPEDMAAARERLAGCQVVLVDTPGRSPRDRARLDELAAFLRAARPTRTHLVLSAAASPASLRATVQRFEGARADCVLLTKLDEAAGLGIACHAAEATSLPFSYLTTGQEVPDHIEPARAERLARLVLEGELGP
jgi:flagellar biosynthesis protein FlhF